MEKIKQLELPSVAPIISVDAGPGVGVNNLEIKARFVEMCMIQQTDTRVRIHRARGDSVRMKLRGQMHQLQIV